MEWLPIVQSVGVPVTILAAFAWGVWQSLRWIGHELVIPFRDRLLARVLDLLDRTDHTLTLLNAHLERMAATITRHADVLDRIDAATRATADRVVSEHAQCRSEHCGLQQTLDQIREDIKRRSG
jgi:hypothetical protein